jgi:hypothetical protein
MEFLPSVFTVLVIILDRPEARNAVSPAPAAGR